MDNAQEMRFELCPKCGKHGSLISGENEAAFFCKNNARISVCQAQISGHCTEDNAVALVKAIKECNLPEDKPVPKVLPVCLFITGTPTEQAIAVHVGVPSPTRITHPEHTTRQ